ncbi:MAB_1171c family putative transporter [Kitasatospora sp. NPDC093102]|uniref:MAB_1171c family putative transporter n=1 Tax=Kitasatospora sp. NPDC093102 TaxID=3155069 RepID=UPI0034169517
MLTVYRVVLPALLWTLTIWRAPSTLGGSRPARYLWGFIASMAVVVSTIHPEVERFVRVCTGSPDVVILLKHLFGLAAYYFTLEYVIAVHGRRPRRKTAERLRIVLLVAAALALTALFVLCFEHDPGVEARMVTDAHLGDPSVKLYEGIVYAYLGSSTALSAKLFWSNRRSVPRGLLRAGLLSMAAGCGVGFVYTLYRVCFLAGRERSPSSEGAPVDLPSQYLPVAAIFLVVVGLALSPLLTAVRYVEDQWALWRLYPLWSDLMEAAPTVAFGPRVGRARDLFTLGDRTLDVAHRAFEIRDAALVLRDRAIATGAGRSDTADAPHDDVDARARTEAAWLFAALHPDRRAGAADTLPGPPGARTPGEEVAWLLKVAAAYTPLRAGARTSAS